MECGRLFFFLPVCGRKLLSCLLRESQQIWVMYGFLFLFLFDGLWTIDRLSILPMTYQRFSPSPFLLMVIWILHDLFLVLVNLFLISFPKNSENHKVKRPVLFFFFNVPSDLKCVDESCSKCRVLSECFFFWDSCFLAVRKPRDD